MTETEKELLEGLRDMVRQHCYHDEKGRYDSGALSANADALELLAKHGLFEIESSRGRMVIGRFK